MRSNINDTRGFVIFGQGRSGSNLLRSLINCHPEIHCDNELFNLNRVREQPFLRKLYINLFPFQYISEHQKNANTLVYGFKFFFFHRRKPEKIVNKLYNDGWKIIHISRKNTLKQSFSGVVGRIKKSYIRKADSPPPTENYNIKPKKIAYAITRRTKALKSELAILEQIPHLSIVYEDDLQSQENWHHAMNKVFNFLDLAPAEVSSHNAVSDPRSDRERIENFDEIIEFLEKNGFRNQVEQYFKIQGERK